LQKKHTPLRVLQLGQWALWSKHCLSMQSFWCASRI